MKKEDWKYLVKELFLYYRQDYITKFVKISKVSLYRWLKGEAYPRFIETKMRLLKLARKIDNKNSLIRKSKIKERKLIKLSKKPKLSIKNKKITINTIPLIFEEIKEREKKSANNWYIKDIDKNYITIKYFGNYNERFIKLPLKIKFDEELAKIIGFWFGDGTTNKPSYVLHRSYITFVNEDISVLKYLKRFLFNLKQNNDSEIEIIKGKLVNK
ncbi:MAG: hypothetical protein ISS95_00605, partial [Candidatus Aenigmarchaeota archaeon]|nr:hypothetical protein [Candidatus Aenigmarchaeota archaeon]